MNKFINYYFLGIGGIGMSALARYLHVKGFQVAGYDRTETKLTSDLLTEGISVSFKREVAEIPVAFTKPESTLVIITPAMPHDHPQLRYFQENKFTIQKRATPKKWRKP